MTLQDLLSLPLEEKIGQLFVIGLPGPSLDAPSRSLLDDVKPGGVCLFARNMREARQTRELLDGVQDVLNVPPILCVDQEGGLVDRLRRIITPMPAPASISTVEAAAKLGSIVAEALRVLGFNLNFAPVVDVVSESRAQANNGLFSRTFGASANEVVELAGAFLAGLQDGGCTGCLKHFPGLGASAVDSHEELPVVELTMDEMWETDLVPYRELNQSAHAVMVAHAAYPNVHLQETDQSGKLLPSSLSYAFVTELLRNNLNFDGVVLTDDLEMGAILKNYGIGEACRRAIGAGQDMLAICADPGRIREGYNSILDAVLAGKISETRIDESLGRIAVFKALLQPALPFDESRLNSLSGEIENLKADLK
ncbi:MAG TPA: glycoside hydrolase family 3 N-terminal domain-containing protein [Pyrinomonadaceae bacterium]|nr:glycoside hydrolase family 3 N-terminal domain-containing protein [Pyrinomonadaceae bacterium]